MISRPLLKMKREKDEEHVKDIGIGDSGCIEKQSTPAKPRKITHSQVIEGLPIIEGKDNPAQEIA